MKTRWNASGQGMPEIKRDADEQQYYDWSAATLSLKCEVCGMMFRAKKRRKVCNLECSRKLDGKSEE